MQALMKYPADLQYLSVLLDTTVSLVLASHKNIARGANSKMITSSVGNPSPHKLQ